jgi:LmbE family N-acetylglucosaminyl deacetylase
MPNRALLAAALAVAALVPSPAPGTSAPPEVVVDLPFHPLPYDQGATGLGLALRRLGTTGRVLYVTAHPDDEDNGLLVALSRGRGLHVTLFTLTRGAGGLNEIGPELFQELSVLRTEETAARGRYDGVEQRFGRADDFGYSYSVEECLQRWGRDEMLSDLVAAMRRLRPDVVITMPSRAAGGGAAHSASARLAALAFAAAADPQRFADQLSAGLQPWQASTLFEAGVGGPGRAAAADVTIETAAMDPLLGMGWTELGSLARGSHRTQATSAVKAPPGQGRSPLQAALRAPGAPAAPPSDLFDPVDVSVKALAQRFGADPAPLLAAESAAARAKDAYDASRPQAALPALQDGLAALRRAAAAAAGLPEPRRGLFLDRLAEEEGDFGAAIAAAMGLTVEPVADSASAVPGTPVLVTTHVRTAVSEPAVEQVTLAGAAGWTVRDAPGPAREPGASAFTVRHEATPAPDARPTQPHWHIEPGRDRNRLDAVPDPTLPWPPPELVAKVTVATTAGPLTVRMPVYGVGVSAAVGERLTPLRVVPRLSLRVEPRVLPMGLGARDRAVRVYATAMAAGPGRTSVRLVAPPGWRVSPAERAVAWSRAGEEVGALFRVSAPAAPSDGLLRAVEGDGAARAQWLEIDYPHVHARPLVREAAARALALDLKVARGAAVGYVEGAGDVVASAIEALGVPVRRLGAGDLAAGDLSAFSTIVLGVRAYQARPDLRAHNGRLLQYARDGGHLVLQLGRAELNQLAPLPFGSVSPARSLSPFTPYAGRVGVGRVADERAPVTLRAPAHPLLRAPNRLGPADFAGWVQERGSFLFEGADARYVELLGAGDPWPENAGEREGLLTEAAVGRGTWTYVGLNLFRQLYVGTPGAYRILANIVSRPRASGPGAERRR